MLKKQINLIFIILLVSIVCPIQQARSATIYKSVSNAGLAGYWSFDEGRGTLASDSSLSKNSGQIVNATWVDGRKGKALKFNGVDSAVNLGDVLDMVNSPMTLAAWVKVDSWKNFDGIIAKLSSSGNYRLYAMADGKIYFGIRASSGTYEAFGSDSVLSTNAWHFVAATFDNASTGKIYVDGSLAGQKTDFSVIRGNNNNGLEIGRTTNNDSSFNGLIDDVRIYSRALSAAEISTLYIQNLTQANISQTQPAKLSDGLAGYWGFSGRDISGTTVNDLSGQNNNGTITGAVPATGKIGQALKFNGTSGYVKANNTLNLTQEYSYSLWMKINNLKASGIIGNSAVATPPLRSGSGYNHLIYLDSDNTLNYMVYNGVVRTLASPALKAGVWYHVVATQSASSGVRRFYVNGVKVGEDNQSSSQSFARLFFSFNKTETSYTPAVDFFDGSLDEVRLYNRALTPTEVTALYNQAATGVNTTQSQINRISDGLVGYWGFSSRDISGTTVKDLSGQNNNGVITGAVPVAGKVGQALSFSAANSNKVIITDPGANSSLDVSQITMSMWIKPKTLAGGWQGLFVKTSVGVYEAWLYGSAVRFGLTINGTNNRDNYNANIQPGVWYFLTFTYDGNVKKLYINGVLKQQWTRPGTISQSDSLIRMGWSGYSTEYFNGIIDEVRLYNRALSASEVKVLYTMGK